MSANRMGFRGYIMITRSFDVIRTKPAVTTQFIRTASTLRKFKTWYRSLFEPKIIRPPYNHICQIGDPVLRRAAERVPGDKIRSPEIQEIIATLQAVMKKYEAVSLSAPQIGVPLQIFVVELNQEHLSKYSDELKNLLNLKEIPRRVLINPSVKVTNYNQDTHIEQCQSVRGFSADVSRYTALKVTAFDENGERQTWEADGHEARAVQHEMDHLAGVLFTDRMNARTFQCSAWEAVNQNRGNVYVTFWPKKKRTLFGYGG